MGCLAGSKRKKGAPNIDTNMLYNLLLGLPKKHAFEETLDPMNPYKPFSIPCKTFKQTRNFGKHPDIIQSLKLQTSFEVEAGF